MQKSKYGTNTQREASESIAERRQTWYGHVARRDQEHVPRKVLRMDTPGKRNVGRPQTGRKNVCQRYLAPSAGEQTYGVVRRRGTFSRTTDRKRRKKPGGKGRFTTKLFGNFKLTLAQSQTTSARSGSVEADRNVARSFRQTRSKISLMLFLFLEPRTIYSIKSLLTSLRSFARW